MDGWFIEPNHHGYSAKFSPFTPDRLAVATSQHYGLSGSGKLFILDLEPNNGALTEALTFNWSDGLFDLSWSENDESNILVCSGDGTIHLLNISNPSRILGSIYHEHHKEVCSVDWVKSRDQQVFLSSSWDKSVKLWDPFSKNSIITFIGHTDSVHQAVFSVHIPNCFASVGGDGFLKIWDSSSNDSQLNIKAHDAEVLSCDWSKYDKNLLLTAASDRLIRGWDLRLHTQPVFQLKGHESAVKKVQFAPHFDKILASVSYDFTTRIWNLGQGNYKHEIFSNHSEYVYGLDWNCLKQGQIVDCGWDSIVRVFTPDCLKDFEL